MILSCKNLSVRAPQGQHHLVRSIDLSLHAGEITAVISANGAGKSSLIKALAGDLDYSGQVIAPRLSSNPRLRARQVAVLPQFSLLSFPYRVHQVVNLGRIPHATGQQIDQEIVDQALELMDITYLRDRNYMACSGGEKQRVHIARILAQIWRPEDAEHQTRLLLLDEPNTALDLGHQQQLMKAVKQFASQGVAVLMVSHDVNLAAQYADQILAMLCSETLALGTVAEVIKADVLSKVFQTEVEIIEHPSTGAPIVLNKHGAIN